MERFFRVMAGFLEGEASAADVERALGPSRSGTARMALYATLVARQRREALDALFPAVKHACAGVRATLWDELARAFVREHPPTHWEPNRIGQSFAGYLAACRGLDASLPTYLEELADYAFIRFEAATAVAPRDGVGVDVALFVRRYEHDVVAFTRVLEDRPAADLPTSPVAEACTLIVAWSRTAHRVIELHPSLATLAAIGRRVGDDSALRRPDAPSQAEVDAADDDLVLCGVLFPRSVG